VIVGPVTLNSGEAVAGGSAILTFSNVISGAGALAINGGAAVRVNMAGTNNYAGNTTVRAGTLTLLGTARLTNSPAINTLAAGTLDASAVGSLAMPTGQVMTNAGITTVGAGTITLGTGSYIVNSGTITAATVTATSTATIVDNGNITGTVNIGSGSTMAGSGTVGGNLTISAGGLLTPGGTGGIGKITTGLSPQLSGQTLIEIDKGNAATNDQVFASGPVIYGGTLTVTNIGATPLAAGDTFKVFNGSSYPTAFAATNLPSLAGGLVWNTALLNTSGTLSISNTVLPGPTTNATITRVTVSSTNMLIHGTNNNVPNTSFHYVVLTTSNITNALSNWTPVVTNPFNPDGTFDYTNPIVPGTPQQFIDVMAVP
jgi:autotransporter-associated beta strand protein